MTTDVIWLNDTVVSVAVGIYVYVYEADALYDQLTTKSLLQATRKTTNSESQYSCASLSHSLQGGNSDHKLTRGTVSFQVCYTRGMVSFEACCTRGTVSFQACCTRGTVSFQAWQLGLISVNFHFLTGPGVSLQISLGKSDRLQSWVGASSRYYFQTSNYGILEPGMGMRPREEWGISYIVLCSDSSFVRSNARTTTAGTERKACTYWAHRHTHAHRISNYLHNIIMTGPYVCRYTL